MWAMTPKLRTSRSEGRFPSPVQGTRISSSTLLAWPGFSVWLDIADSAGERPGKRGQKGCGRRGALRAVNFGSARARESRAKARAPAGCAAAGDAPAAGASPPAPRLRAEGRAPMWHDPERRLEKAVERFEEDDV